jgi:hypothetical protein
VRDFTKLTSLPTIAFSVGTLWYLLIQTCADTLPFKARHSASVAYTLQIVPGGNTDSAALWHCAASSYCRLATYTVRKLCSDKEVSMHPDDLMKADLLSEILLVSSGALLFVALILVLAAAMA